MMKFLATAALAVLVSVPALAEDIKVGVTPGEHAQIMEKVKDVAATKGLNIEILEFSDYVVPNQGRPPPARTAGPSAPGPTNPPPMALAGS